jgi:predicted MFS family arabinose efflux permease
MTRDFRLLWLAQTTSKLGSGVTSVALPLVAVSALDASTFQVALLAALAWLPWLIIGLPAGAWVDRMPRRPLMITCDLLCLGLYLAVPLAWWLGALTIGHLVATALLAGTASVFFHTAYQVYLPALLRPEQLPAGNARLQTTESAANVLGPGLAGLIAQAVGAVFGLLADAATFLVSAICLSRIRTVERLDRCRSVSLRREIAEGLRFLARDPYLRVLTVFGAASNLVLLGYQSVLVVFLVRTVGISPGTVGAMVAGMSLGGVAGAAGAPLLSRRLGSARAMLAANIGTAPFGLLLPLAAPGPLLGLAVAGGAVMVAGIAAGNVIKGSFRQAYTPRHLLGRVLVGMQLLNFGAIPVGALLGGTLGTTLGPRTTMWLMLTGVALAGLILLAGPLRRDRDLPAAPAQAREPAAMTAR